MGYSNQFFEAISIQQKDRKSLNTFSKKSTIPLSRLRYYNDNNILPTGQDLEFILETSGITEVELMLKMGCLDRRVLEEIQKNSHLIYPILNSSTSKEKSTESSSKLVFQTDLGNLYQGDCLPFMKSLPDNSVDLVFADPPFNLNKIYPSKINDSLKTEKYLDWCQQWMYECIRILKNGGSFFSWNLPKWNSLFTNYLGGRLSFRHWIAVDIKYSLPIQGRLYPSHYSLLYYVKGQRPNVFHPDRLPMSICPHCYKDLKDYGGYKNKMNPKGVNITDVWLDITPVRHAKYKRRSGANELPLKLLDRIVEMSSNPGDLIFDPFGGSGTTYMASELKERRWIGIEIGSPDDIVERFKHKQQERDILENCRVKLNTLFTEGSERKRKSLGLWTSETFNVNSPKYQQRKIDFSISKKDCK